MSKSSQNLIHEYTVSIAESYRPCVRPIYKALSSEKIEHIGSCFLIAFDNKHYLVTAAHVLDHRTKPNELLLLTDGKAFSLDGKFTASIAPNGCREDDKLDIAFLPLLPEHVSKLGAKKFFDKFSPHDANPEGKIYFILGYPNTKNEPDDWNGTIEPVLYPYASTAHAGTDHLFVSYDKKKMVYSDTGQKSNGLKLVGVSGGVLVEAGVASNTEIFNSVHEVSLAGMIIELQNKEIVCVKIQTILDAIKNQ